MGTHLPVVDRPGDIELPEPLNPYRCLDRKIQANCHNARRATRVSIDDQRLAWESG